jgi:hypothetical protein
MSGEKAMEYVRAQVAFGPRPPGSPQLMNCREYIIRQLRSFGYRVDDDSFVAETPYIAPATPTGTHRKIRWIKSVLKAWRRLAGLF